LQLLLTQNWKTGLTLAFTGISLGLGSVASALVSRVSGLGLGLDTSGVVNIPEWKSNMKPPLGYRLAPWPEIFSATAIAFLRPYELSVWAEQCLGAHVGKQADRWLYKWLLQLVKNKTLAKHNYSLWDRLNSLHHPELKMHAVCSHYSELNNKHNA